MKKIEEKIKSKMTAMPRLMEKSVKIVMWKFLRGGATFIPGATSIPESRVLEELINLRKIELIYSSLTFLSKPQQKLVEKT